MSNLVEILVTAKNLTGPTMAAVNAEVDKTNAKMKLLNKTAGIAAAGFAVIGVEAVKMASKFDSEMTLLQTQAGVSADKIGGLKKGVLDLAGKVGQDPDSLAESLFHVESNFESMGISSAKALKLTETAAKGATVGHANLVDVTNALTAAVAANIPGVENLDGAMGILNATVGVGDMKMQDLAKAFGSGMVATVKGFGLNVQDVGAALAVFGDNNIRGALAGNQLRMSVMALAKPVQGGAEALKSIGLEQDTLAKDMQKGGLKLALEDLVAHMNAAGISSKQQGQIITDAFGRKAGSGLNILVGQMDRLESKYPALEEGAKGFGKSWADTQKTFAFQVKQLEMSFDALMIGMGEKIIPPLQSFIHLLAAHKQATVDATLATAGLLAGVVALSAALKVAAGVKLAWAALSTGALAAKSAFETVALKAMYMRDASVAAGGGLKGLTAAFGTLSTGAKLGIAVVAIGAIVLALDKLGSSGKHAPDVDRMSTALGNLALTGKASGELTATFGKNLDGLGYAIDRVSGKSSGMDKFNDVMNGIFTLGLRQSNSMRAAKADIDGVDKGLADLVNNGHADEARAALTKLYAAGQAVPVDKLDNYEAALAATKLQSDLTAASQGRFGDQAQQVQQQLQAQKDVADGLAQSLQALDQVSQDSYNSQTKLYDAIGKATESLKENGKTLSLTSEKGRANRDALSAIAAATDDYTQKLSTQGASMATIDAAYSKGYDSLVHAAEGFGLATPKAKALADSLLRLPSEVKLQANVSDLEAKLKAAKAQLSSVPPSKKAKLIGDIADLERKIRAAKAEIAGVQGKTVGINIVTTHTSAGTVGHEGGRYAVGGRVLGPGSGTSDDVPIWASNGEFVVNAKSASRHRALLEAINSGSMDGYASGGSVAAKKRAAAAKALAEAEHSAASEALGSLGISYFGRVAGYKTSNFQNAVGPAAGGIGDLAQSLNDWASKIRAATHGSQESKLIRDFDRFGAAALKNEKALLSVNSRLDAARDKLSALKDSFNQLKDSVASSVVAYGSIAKQGTGQPGGAKSVINQLATDTATAKRFAADLEALRKKGLNSQSLSELAQAGIDGGGLENAERLLGASKGDISQINSLEKQLQAAGSAAGTSTATSMYGAGIKQAQGLVDGLAKQQKHLNDIMAKAAAAMAAELKRALGRKASGGTVGAAAAGGARWGRTLVGEYGPEIADLPVGTRVHSAPDTARMLGGGASERPLVVQVMLDGRVVAEQLVEPTRDLVQRRAGGDVQRMYGRRTR